MSNSANFEEGIGAGFIARLVLSMIMLMKQAMGVMPQLNSIEMDHSYGGGSTPLVAGLGHFIGTILWGSYTLGSILSSRAPLGAWSNFCHRRLAHHYGGVYADGGCWAFRSAARFDGSGRDPDVALVLWRRSWRSVWHLDRARAYRSRLGADAGANGWPDLISNRAAGGRDDDQAI
jgi:hypothetical protein